MSTIVSWRVLLAQEGAAPLAQLMFPLLIILMLGYFLLVRPQQREQANRRQMIEQLKKNDRVVTIGGIYGVVTNVRRDADEVTIKVDETSNTKLRMTLSAVSKVLGEDSSSDSPSK